MNLFSGKRKSHIAHLYPSNDLKQKKVPSSIDKVAIVSPRATLDTSFPLPTKSIRKNKIIRIEIPDLISNFSFLVQREKRKVQFTGRVS